MSNFVPTKRNLRKVLLFCFHLIKSAANNQRMLSETYSDYTPSILTCEYWFLRYKKDDFDTKDKERPDQPKNIENVEVEA